MRYLAETLTYDQLFRMSEPKRVFRSHKVKGPPMEIDSYQDAVYYAYNFKSHPSTTGLRHRGYVKFLKPKHGGQKPLQHLNCVVDCTCPDFRYRWAWANKQRGASRVGAQSLNQALNRAPRRTNPTSRPGLCKHVLAAREYIYGLLSSFPNDTPDTSDKLNKLTQFATRRWINFPEQMAAAKERDRLTAAARAARNLGQEPIPAEVIAGQADALDQAGREAGDDEAYAEVLPPEIRDAPELAKVPPPPTSFATNVNPPGARGRTMPTGKAAQAAPPKPKRIQKPSDQITPDKTASVSKSAGFRTPAEYNFRRRQGLGDSLGYGNGKVETNRVVTMNGLKNMTALTEAQQSVLSEAKQIVVELEQDELAALRNAGNEDEAGGPGNLPPVDDQGGGNLPPEGGDEMGAMGGEPMGAEMGGPGGPGGPGGDLPPSEPPMSDSAAGADTEGSAALGLLREIRDFLGQLASALVPQEEPGAEMGGAAMPIEGEEAEGELEVPEPGAAGEEGGEGEGGGEFGGGEGEGDGESEEGGEGEEESDEEKRPDKDKE